MLRMAAGIRRARRRSLSLTILPADPSSFRGQRVVHLPPPSHNYSDAHDYTPGGMQVLAPPQPFIVASATPLAASCSHYTGVPSICTRSRTSSRADSLFSAHDAAALTSQRQTKSSLNFTDQVQSGTHAIDVEMEVPNTRKRESGDELIFQVLSPCPLR
jgi:hypothetical protein